MMHSAAVGTCRSGQAQPKQLYQFDSGARLMFAAMQITEAIKPLDAQRQAGQQPGEQQTVGVMVTDVSQSVAVFSVIEPLVFDLPTAFRAMIEHPTADCSDWRIGEPESFDNLTVRFLLAVEQHPHGFPP